VSRFLNKGLRADNSTGFKGVTATKTGFLARVQAQDPLSGGGRVVYDLHRSRHATAEDAAHAYDEAVRDLYGNEAPRFNFPKVGEKGLDGEVRAA
jgi:hypothetical protein